MIKRRRVLWDFLSALALTLTGLAVLLISGSKSQRDWRDRR